MKIVFFFLVYLSVYADMPKLMLLNVYTNDKNVTGWYMSEKLDGVRAFWDGKELVSRGGTVFNAPSFFIKKFPKHKLDGELWSKEGKFDKISSIVRSSKKTSNWSELTYNVFEVPNQEGNLTQRLSVVKKSKYLRTIEQIKIKDIKHLNTFLKEVEQKGGEGVVVRDASLEYFTGRTDNALKVKRFLDTECVVISYNEGKGKYKNKLGSLNCKLKDDKIIKIGTGFTDKQRENPPKINAIVTFKYYGLTSKGNPRFPVFLRQKN